MRRAMIVGVLWVAIAARTGGEEPGTTLKADNLTDAQMEAFLTEAKIVHTRDISAGLTGTVRATLSLDGVAHDAHIQSIDLAKSVGTLTAGAEIDFRDSSQALSRTDPGLLTKRGPGGVRGRWADEVAGRD